jgi:hydroxymethylbilane synthase
MSSFVNPVTQLTIATRQSPLALWQAHYVKQALLSHYPQLQVELLPLVTQGDKNLTTSLAKIGGKGLFIKELERALLSRQADIAVHSMKDIPMELPTDFTLAAICKRQNPGDVLVTQSGASLAQLPVNARLGTSSLRRQAQLQRLRPDIHFITVRGNVGTRLAKLDQGECNGLVLAAAGLIRLGLSQRITEYLTCEQCLPSPGQGAIGIEIRRGDQALRHLLAPLHHPPTACRVLAERAMNRRLAGSCQVPVAGFAELLPKQQLWLRGLVAEPDGSQCFAAQVKGPRQQAEQLGQQVAEQILSQGADAILAKYR